VSLSRSIARNGRLIRKEQAVSIALWRDENRHGLNPPSPRGNGGAKRPRLLGAAGGRGRGLAGDGFEVIVGGGDGGEAELFD
jgi:hypothetical protein